MKEKTKSKITIDDLAVMVARGFEDMDKNFDQKLEQKLDHKLGSLRYDMEEGFKQVEENFKKVRNDILNMSDKFVTHREFESLSGRVTRLEQKSQGE